MMMMIIIIAFFSFKQPIYNMLYIIIYIYIYIYYNNIKLTLCFDFLPNSFTGINIVKIDKL